jgi:predicted DNA-binding transcriptional regulator AlpA
MSSTLLRPHEAAKLLGVSSSTLAKWRCQGNGPGFVKVGPRCVAYSISALDQFIALNRRNNTSQIAAR